MRLDRVAKDGHWRLIFLSALCAVALCLCLPDLFKQIPTYWYTRVDAVVSEAERSHRRQGGWRCELHAEFETAKRRVRVRQRLSGLTEGFVRASTIQKFVEWKVADKCVWVPPSGDAERAVIHRGVLPQTMAASIVACGYFLIFSLAVLFELEIIRFRSPESLDRLQERLGGFVLFIVIAMLGWALVEPLFVFSGGEFAAIGAIMVAILICFKMVMPWVRRVLSQAR
jgi:hypothetical protein